MNERLFAEFDNPEETAVERNLKRESIQAVFSHLGADFSDIIQQDNEHRKHNPDSVSVTPSTDHYFHSHHQQPQPTESLTTQQSSNKEPNNRPTEPRNENPNKESKNRPPQPHNENKQKSK